IREILHHFEHGGRPGPDPAILRMPARGIHDCTGCSRRFGDAVQRVGPEYRLHGCLVEASNCLIELLHVSIPPGDHRKTGPEIRPLSCPSAHSAPGNIPHPPFGGCKWFRGRASTVSLLTNNGDWAAPHAGDHAAPDD